jgi:lipopolysaccharide transport system ATP-binding protein
MRVRLAFAVAAHLEPDVLLMDEVLAVGDAAFQQKCLSKMGEVAHGGRTVLFVSHNLGAVRSLCSRAIWLEGGTLRGNGAPDEVIAEYLQQMAGELSSDGAVQLSEADGDDGPVRLLSVALKDGDGHVQSQFQSDESVFVEVAYRVKERVTGMRVNLQLKTRTGDLVFVTTDHDQRDELDAHGDYVSRCEIPKALLNTELYTVGVAIGIPGLRVLVPQRDLLTLSIAGVGQHGSSYPERWPGVVAPRLRWTVERAS